MLLERCVVSVDPDFDEVFEIMDGNKESYLFKVSQSSNEILKWSHKLFLTAQYTASQYSAIPEVQYGFAYQAEK